MSNIWCQKIVLFSPPLSITQECDTVAEHTISPYVCRVQSHNILLSMNLTSGKYLIPYSVFLGVSSSSGVFLHNTSIWHQRRTKVRFSLFWLDNISMLQYLIRLNSIIFKLYFKSFKRFFRYSAIYKSGKIIKVSI